MTMNVPLCPACHGNHTNLPVTAMLYRVGRLTHKAICPTSGLRIFLKEPQSQPVAGQLPPREEENNDVHAF